MKSVGEDKISNVSQALILNPKPELNDKMLFCTYIQVDETGREIYKEELSIDLRVHYLSSGKQNNIVETASTGDNLNIRYNT